MALYVYNFAIKTIEEISPSNVAASSVILLFEISECFVVSDHCEGLSSHELIKPLHEGFQYAKSFQLISEISTLCQSEFFQHESGSTANLPVLAFPTNNTPPTRASVRYYPDVGFHLF